MGLANELVNELADELVDELANELADDGADDWANDLANDLTRMTGRECGFGGVSLGERGNGPYNTLLNRYRQK